MSYPNKQNKPITCWQNWYIFVGLGYGGEQDGGFNGFVFEGIGGAFFKI